MGKALPVRTNPDGNRLGLTNSFRNGPTRRRDLADLPKWIALGLVAITVASGVVPLDDS